MLNRIFGKNTHTYLHVFGLSCIAIGIPLNKIVMSLGMMFLVLNLLLEGDYKTYFRNLKKNKAYLLILGFFLMHAISILWSSNFHDYINDLRVKLPLLVLPTVIVAKPIVHKIHLNIILWCFSLTAALLSMINYLSYNQFLGHRIYLDFRDMSLFSSHIRFSIIISMAVLILISFLKKNANRLNLLLIILISWLTYYTFYSQVLSGILTLFSGLSVFVIIKLWPKNKWLILPIFTGITVTVLTAVIWTLTPVRINQLDYYPLESDSPRGNPYAHVLEYISPETKKPTHIYVCSIELDNDWKLYSAIPIDSLDLKGQPIKETLIRYLASKDLRKDSDGLTQLSKDDIHRIEMGEASFRENNFLSRLYGIKYQISNPYDPNGHSILQRIEYWKTGVQITQKNLLIGTGSGDVQDEFNKQYIINHSELRIENRKRAHNYYLTILITFGIVGLLYFLWTVIYFIRFNLDQKAIIGILFMVVILSSFLVEDTIETQTGVTFFGLFYGLYCFKKDLIQPEK